jgi:hypothetical protein
MALAGAVVLVGAPLVFVYVFGVDLHGEDQTGAVLALAGAMCTALVSLIAAVLGAESARRQERQRDAEEQRLRLDAAMRAGELLDRPQTAPDPAAVAAGLLALTQLSRADLAVALLVDIWDVRRAPKPKVSDETAVLVIDAALRSDRPNAQLVAAELLCRNAERLDICQSLHWPAAIDGCWDEDFGPMTKLLIIDALVHQALTSVRRAAALHALAVRLYGISEGDPDPHVEGCVGKLLAAIVPEFVGEGTIMHGPREVSFDDLRRAAAKAEDNPDRYLSEVATDRAVKLRVWAGDCHGVDYSPGALAAAPHAV